MRSLGVATSPDPLFIRPAFEGFNNTRGKTFSNPRLTPGETTAVLVGCGQSNMANAIDTPYTPVNGGKIDNLNHMEGGMYVASDPLLGPDSPGGNVLLRIADKLITGGIFQRVILVCIARSSTSIVRHAPGGDLNPFYALACRRAAAVGLSPTAFLWQQGESDHGMAQSTYLDSLNALIASVRSAGFTAPWFIGKSTYNGGEVDANVRAACGAIVNGTSIFAGADTDDLAGLTYRQPGDVHFNATGANIQANRWKSAIDAVF